MIEIINPAPILPPVLPPIKVVKNRYTFTRNSLVRTYKFATEIWTVTNIGPTPKKGLQLTPPTILREYRCNFRPDYSIHWEYRVNNQYIWAHPEADIILTDLRGQTNLVNKFQLYVWYKILLRLDQDCRRFILQIILSFENRSGQIAERVVLSMPYI